MNAVWKAVVWAVVTVTPAMFCTADTPVVVTVVTALLTEMPGYAAAKEAVMDAPLVVDSALDTDVAVTVGASDGANVGVARVLAAGHVVLKEVGPLESHEVGTHGTLVVK